MKRGIWLVVFVLLIAGGIGGYLYTQSRANAPRFRTARAERGPLTAAVSATGNLNAVILVQVGSQVSGQIKELFADFNTVVHRNQVVARIDPDQFQAKVDQGQADLESAKATVLNQQAQVVRARSDLENARAAAAEAKAQTAKALVAVADTKRTYDRNAELYGRNLIAAADRDTAQAGYDSAVAQHESAIAHERALTAAIDTAEAQLKVQQAALTAAQATVRQKQAALDQARIDLEHTTIRAPVDGVVVSRQVDVGQTVAASLQAPVLFTIAQDLTQMQVETSVDEADVGRLKVGDQASFTVDAYSGETFTGTVTQIRKAPQVVQNVVTYTVIVGVDNPGGRLLPGMTANVKLVFSRKPDVLKVPNAALRYRPPGADAGSASGGGGGAAGGGPGGGPSAHGGRFSPDTVQERLTQSLGLSEDQQRRLKPILEDTAQELKGLAKLADSERRARAQQIREATAVRIREILTPEQRKRYDAMDRARAESGPTTTGRVWVVGRDGKAQAVSLSLGISDGNFTEVVRGELQPGQDVIIGGSAGGTGSAGPGGPRLRL